MLWYQGLAEAPYLVKRCVESWRRMNPGWNVVFLDEANLHVHLPADAYPDAIRELDLTKQSNFVRLWLLSQRGGVWADATTICRRPLDTWIDGVTPSGFFAFRRPGPDRLLSTWFLASRPGCPIVVRLMQAYVSFFALGTFDNRGPLKQRVISWLGRRLNGSHRTTRHWLSPLVTRGLRVYPYFVCHYLFERLVATDPECRAVWDATPDLAADGPHRVQALGQHAPLDEAVKRELDERRSPLYKLSWKTDHGRCEPSSVLHYVLEDGE